MRAMSVILASVCLAMTLGCALPQRKAKVVMLEGGTLSTITLPADLRGVYVTRQTPEVKLCAEPAPDVALESVEKVTANLKTVLQSGQTIEGSVATEFASKVMELAGRTQLVLLAREMLYRACELSINHNTGPEKALELYTIVANLVRDLGQADKEKAKADVLKQIPKEALTRQGVDIQQYLSK